MKTYKLNNVEVSKQELQELIKNNPELLEKNDKNWRADKPNNYYYISPIGSIVNDDITLISRDDFCFNTLNYFQTEEQAEAYRDYLLAVGRVSRAIWEANGDWEDGDKVYYIGRANILYCFSKKMSRYPLVIPAIKSREIAEQIIENYEEDLLTIFNYKR